MSEFKSLKGEEIYQILKDLCEFGYRRIGTPEAINAEKFIHDKLIEVGITDPWYFPQDRSQE